MERKGIGTPLLIVIIVIIVAVAGAGVYVITRPKAEFRISNLTVGQKKVAKGDTVTVSAKVKNIGDAEGTYEANLLVNGKPSETEEVTIPPEQSMEITFSIRKEVLGTYEVDIGELSESFTVKEPTNFEISDLHVSPKSVRAGENITVSAIVKNVGGLEGAYEAGFEINGSTVYTKEITVAPGENQEINFSMAVMETGPRDVSLADLTTSYTTLKPFPYEGDYLKYEFTGLVAFFGHIEGTVTYEVTNVTREKYTTTTTPSGDLATIMEPETETFDIGQSAGFSEEVEKGTFIGTGSKETKFGTMELSHYRFENQTEYGQENTDVYLESETGIALSARLESWMGNLRAELTGTNINYLIAKAKE